MVHRTRWIWWGWVVIGMLLIVTPLYGQEKHFALSMSGTFTTSSKLFHHANDADEFIRSQFVPLDNIFSVGIDIRRSIDFLRLDLGMSIEYITTSDHFNAPLTSSSSLVPVTDGFTVVPVEFTGYFPIPIGSESIRFYMGGGVGAYFGNRKYVYAGVPAEVIERKTGAGIHILSGIEYLLGPHFSIRSEVKFRDVQCESVNQIQRATTILNGSVIPLDQVPFASRINIDGMAIGLALVVHL